MSADLSEFNEEKNESFDEDNEGAVENDKDISEDRDSPPKKRRYSYVEVGVKKKVEGLFFSFENETY